MNYFLGIVDQYGLNEFYSNNEIPKHKWDEKDTEFHDPKLQSMWRRAEEAGFSGKKFSDFVYLLSPCPS